MNHQPTCHVRVRLADGGAVMLRPLPGGEVTVVETVFEGLSSQSRHRAFSCPCPGCRDATAGPSPTSTATGTWPGSRSSTVRPVGMCRYVRTTQASAEVAFEIVDASRAVASARRSSTPSPRSPATTGSLARSHGGARQRPRRPCWRRVGIRLRHADGLLEGRGEPRVASCRWLTRQPGAPCWRSRVSRRAAPRRLRRPPAAGGPAGRRATSSTPTGRPSGVVPAGTEIAGQPVTVMKYADRIHAKVVRHLLTVDGLGVLLLHRERRDL